MYLDERWDKNSIRCNNLVVLIPVSILPEILEEYEPRARKVFSKVIMKDNFGFLGKEIAIYENTKLRDNVCSSMQDEIERILWEESDEEWGDYIHSEGLDEFERKLVEHPDTFFISSVALDSKRIREKNIPK